jgi:hypothetical protein
MDPAKLFRLYNFISVVRESDIYAFPFMTKKNILKSHIFYNLDLLQKAYNKAPTLILYAHTGSYYYTIAATATLGYRVYPIAYNVNPSEMEKPFYWLYSLNMKLSEKCFNGGQYIYVGKSTYSKLLKRILKNKENALIYAAIDLPLSFITDKRTDVIFLGYKTALPNQIVNIFVKLKLPIFIALPVVEFVEQRIKRIVTYEPVPPDLTSEEIIGRYAHALEELIMKKPEQIITLINLEAFYEKPLSSL